MKNRKFVKIKESKESSVNVQSNIVGKARSDFNKLLEERGETGFGMRKGVPTLHRRGLFYDFARLVGVLEIPPPNRTESELLLIADELSNTTICQDLGISPAHGLEVAKHATVARFQEKSCIIREGQAADAFFLVLEGTAKQERSVDPDSPAGADGREIIFANIVQAMGIAAADVCGTSDPYACVRVGTREERCRTVPATLQPIWDEVLRVEVPEGEDVETVLISIYDSDAWGDDDYLGSVEVPIAPLRSRRHLYHPYSLALEADDRFVAAADEEGASYAVTGTIIFHLKLTTQGALERIAAAEAMTRKGAEPDLDSLHRFVSGESFGRETMVGGIYPYSLNAEFACTLLRVSRADFIAHLLPLQDADTGRLVELFSEILTLSGWPPERLLSLRTLVNVRRFRAGDTVITEGEPVGGPIFILSGEVYTFKRHGGGLGRPAADGRPASLGAA
eukprot:CAMPEP_0172181166 /NCGR_PEP_ID=MMETSP1050-20130122/17662_1 /TAXON_ID=233186 /ORGANISM="Cryptomonas curvata, Strain CCAP979/52" /LENGTH=450 /DNA_ID=CAMNT_0012854409 /DNA_START=116 /DNA_END=1465 /DNA_ORIENTATION=+